MTQVSHDTHVLATEEPPMQLISVYIACSTKYNIVCIIVSMNTKIILCHCISIVLCGIMSYY